MTRINPVIRSDRPSRARFKKGHRVVVNGVLHGEVVAKAEATGLIAYKVKLDEAKTMLAFDPEVEHEPSKLTDVLE